MLAFFSAAVIFIVFTAMCCKTNSWFNSLFIDAKALQYCKVKHTLYV